MTLTGTSSLRLFLSCIVQDSSRKPFVLQLRSVEKILGLEFFLEDPESRHSPTKKPTAMSTAAVVDHPSAAIPRTSASTATSEKARQDIPHQPLNRLRLVHDLNNPDVPASEILPGHIISSPYPGPTHTLDLSRLTTPSALFARALQTLTPTSDDYATQPYEQGFDFPALFSELRRLVAEDEGFEWPRTDFYVVAFRSVLKEELDRQRLGLLDEKSHEEAVESGGLLKYWFGVPDGERRNLATCKFPIAWSAIVLMPV